MRRRLLIRASVVIALLTGAGVAVAYIDGPPAARTGAPMASVAFYQTGPERFRCDIAAVPYERTGDEEADMAALQLRFQPPLQVTTTAFNPHSPTTSGGKHGAWWIGDYQGITASAGAFHLVWNDTRTGKLGLFAATVHP